MDRRTLLTTAGLGGLGLAAGLLAWRAAPRDTVDGTGFASLAPAITETAFALGGGDRLVARTPWCTLPPEATSLPEAGSALTPDLEALASLGVGHILVDGSAATQVALLERVAPVEVLPWLTTEEVLRSVDRLGALLEVDAADLVARLQAGLAPRDGGPRVAVLLAGPELEQGGPYWFIRADSLHGTAIRAAGYHNAVDGPWSGPPQLSAEALIASDPEVVVVVSAAPSGSADRDTVLGAVARLPLAAARDGQLHLLEGAALLSTGPSILDFVAALAATRS